MAVITDPEALAKIGAIWADTLGVETVAPTDNFFTLGGDSIMVTIMAMQVEQAFDRMVSADLVFDSPTLEGFCQGVFAEEPA